MSRAIELLNEQLTITREIGDRRGAANALSHLGKLFEIAEHPAAATVRRQLANWK